jgi:hypothetical protein
VHECVQSAHPVRLRDPAPAIVGIRHVPPHGNRTISQRRSKFAGIGNIREDYPVVPREILRYRPSNVAGGARDERYSAFCHRSLLD